jgi:hypothetical protein
MEMQRQKVIPLVKAACIFLWLFLRVAYLLILVEGLGEVTRGGGRGEWEPNQIVLQELAYVSGSNHKAKTLQKGE